VEQEQIEIAVQGQMRKVPSIRVDGRHVIVTGKIIKVAKVHDEAFLEGEVVRDPELFVSKLNRCARRPDIFEFAQKFTDPKPKFNYPIGWDNAAAAPTETSSNWWKDLPQETRKNVRRAAKREVSVRVAKFDDELVKGIKAIYDESRFRQGRRFWHFGKDLEAVKKENSTYLERSEFIGAYYKNELIGFMKFVDVNGAAKIMQILSKSAHYDKRPMNALIAKAVEVCHQKGISHLVYSQFIFGNKKESQLMEFKRRNGFEQMVFPRYYVPLTLKGKIAVKMNLHRGLLGVLPSRVINLLLGLRSAYTHIRHPAIAGRKLFAFANFSKAAVPRSVSEPKAEQNDSHKDCHSPV
jgi:hypothetical protein